LDTQGLQSPASNPRKNISQFLEAQQGKILQQRGYDALIDMKNPYSISFYPLSPSFT
jgi:hypothetical protein